MIVFIIIFLNTLIVSDQALKDLSVDMTDNLLGICLSNSQQELF